MLDFEELDFRQTPMGELSLRRRSEPRLDDRVVYEVKLGDIWMVGSGWSMGLEYIWTSLDEGDHPVAVGPGAALPNNPFLIVDPTGTDMKRTKDLFEYSTVGITLNWRP